MFTADDLKQFAQTTLKDAASPVDRAAAKKAIRRLAALKENQKELESCGKKPTRKHFANDADYRAALNAHWDLLDARAVRKQAEKILNDTDSTPLARHNARKRLELLDGPPPPDDEPTTKKDSKCFPTREDFGFLNGLDWPEFVASGKEAKFQVALETWRKNAPPLDPKIAAFLNALDDESFEVPARAPQNATPKPPIAPPIDTSLFCDQCRVPFTVCGCDKVMCSLCLRPQSNCYPPCQNSRR